MSEVSNFFKQNQDDICWEIYALRFLENLQEICPQNNSDFSG